MVSRPPARYRVPRGDASGRRRPIASSGRGRGIRWRARWHAGTTIHMVPQRGEGVEYRRGCDLAEAVSRFGVGVIIHERSDLLEGWRLERQTRSPARAAPPPRRRPPAGDLTPADSEARRSRTRRHARPPAATPRRQRGPVSARRSTRRPGDHQAAPRQRPTDQPPPHPATTHVRRFRGSTQRAPSRPAGPRRGSSQSTRPRAGTAPGTRAGRPQGLARGRGKDRGRLQPPRPEAHAGAAQVRPARPRSAYGAAAYRRDAIVHLMLAQGLRSCEVLSLEPGDLEFHDLTVGVRGKGRSRACLAHPEARAATVTHARTPADTTEPAPRPDTDHPGTPRRAATPARSPRHPNEGARRRRRVAVPPDSARAPRGHGGELRVTR